LSETDRRSTIWSRAASSRCFTRSAIRSHDPDHDRRGRKFKTDGKIIVDPGWLAVYGRQAEGEATRQGICSVVPGEPAKVENIEVKENVTSRHRVTTKPLC